MPIRLPLFLTRLGRQPMSSDQDARQVMVLPRSPPTGMVVPVDLIRSQPTPGAAFSLACATSGLEDQEIGALIGIDAGYFSRMKSGTATLQAAKIQLFCAAVGNLIYVEWIAFQVGCTLTVLQTEAERRLQEAETKLAEKDAEIAALHRMVHGGYSSPEGRIRAVP